MTKLTKNYWCTSQLFAVIILPTSSISVWFQRKKISFLLSLFCFAQRNLSVASIIFSICLQGKWVFQCSNTLSKTVAYSIRRLSAKGTVTSPKKVIFKYHAQKTVDILTSLLRGRQRWSINAVLFHATSTCLFTRSDNRYRITSTNCSRDASSLCCFEEKGICIGQISLFHIFTQDC